MIVKLLLLYLGLLRHVLLTFWYNLNHLEGISMSERWLILTQKFTHIITIWNQSKYFKFVASVIIAWGQLLFYNILRGSE